MNRNQLLILLVLVVVLGGAGIMLHNRQKSSWEGANPAAGKKVLGDFPINDVAHIEIKSRSQVSRLCVRRKIDNPQIRLRIRINRLRPRRDKSDLFAIRTQCQIIHFHVDRVEPGRLSAAGGD